MSTLSAVRTASGGVLRHKVQAFVLLMVLLVSTASATLGLGLMVASNAPYNHAFAAQNGADITLTVNTDKVSAARIAASEHTAGVTAANGPFTEVTVPFDFDGQPWGSIPVVGRSAPAGPVDSVDLTAGHWPDGPGQMVFDARSGLIGGPGGQVQLGSTFQATTLPGEPTFTIVGFATSITRSASTWVTPAQATALQGLVATVAAKCADGTAPASAQCDGQGGATITKSANGATSSRAGAPSAAALAPPLEQVLYRFSTASTQAQISADIKGLSADIPAAAIADTANWLTMQSQNDTTSSIMEPFVIAFALIGLIMAVLIVFNVVSGAVVAQYQRIGVLKSLGMTPGQVITVYLNRIGWPALVGCVIGAILGDLLSVPIMGKTAGAYGVGHQSVPLWVLVAVPLGMLVLTMLSAFAPALQAGRLSATEAIAAGRAPKSGHGYLAHRLMSKVRLPRAITLGLAAPFARPGRTLITLFAIAFGACAVIFAVGLSTSLDRVEVANSQSNTIQAQVQYGGNGTPAGPGQQYPSQAQDNAVTTAVAATPGAAQMDVQYNTQVTVPSVTEKVNATVFTGANAWQDWTMITGHWLTGPGQIVVDTEFLNDSDLTVGDTTTVNTGTSSVTVRIVGEYFNPSRQPNLWASASTLPGTATLANLNGWNIGVKPGTSASAYIASLNKALGNSSPWAAFGQQGGGQFFTIASALIGLLALMVAVASGLGVLNTVLMTTRDKVHDLGIFKAIGMRPGQVLAMVCCWVLAPAIIAAVLAGPAAVELNSATLTSMARAANTGVPGNLTAVFPVAKLALLSLAALVIAAVGALLPGAWAARARPAVALRTE
jgi:putative ABC transport system permease protein